nr:MAG TPA: hypothetical protein [Caudoviricetes sp.]
MRNKHMRAPHKLSSLCKIFLRFLLVSYDDPL